MFYFNQNFEGHILESNEIKLNSLKGQIKYCQDAIDSNLEEWEEKEYNKVMDSCIDEALSIKNSILVYRKYQK